MKKILLTTICLVAMPMGAANAGTAEANANAHFCQTNSSEVLDRIQNIMKAGKQQGLSSGIPSFRLTEL